MECMSFTCVSLVCLSMMAIVGVYSQCERDSGIEGITECLSSTAFPNRKYQAAVCMKRSTLKSVGILCKDPFAEYCWYYCSFTPNNPGFSVCECDPKKNPSALTSAVPLSCLTPDGKDCSWYRRCLETRIPCESTAHPYAITYAEKYCERYGNNYKKFSKNGRKWVDAVRKCLQESMVHVMFPQINISCENVKKRAVSTHTRCYLKPSNEIGLRDLSIGDCLWIFWTVKGAYRDDFFGTLHESWSVIKQYVATRYLHNAVKRLELFVRNAAPYTCDEMATSVAKRLASIQKWSSDIMYYSYCPKRSVMQLEPIPIDVIIGHETNDEAKVNEVTNTLKKSVSDGSLKTLTLEDGHITEVEKIKDCIDPECKSTSFVVGTVGDDPCIAEGGTCQENSLLCNGQYQSSLCGGGITRQCCLPAPAGITGQNVTTGECVCITGTNVNARTSAGLSASVGATLNTGDCFKIHGGILTRDGYQWFELTNVSGTQNLWVAGTLLSKSAASYCSAGSSSSCTTNAKNYACQLLQMHNSRDIDLWNMHPSLEEDNAYALNNINDTCNGHQASRSHYPCPECRSPGAPGGHVCLSESLLRYLVYLGTRGYIHVNEIAGACHSCNSYHYKGTAVDLHPGSRKQEFMNNCTSMGGTAYDEDNHIHCEFNH